MQSAPLHSKELDRLATLRHYELLDTESEQTFDEITALASHFCETPISLISLVDMQRQWFKSRVGLDATETDRSIAFCSHAILENQVFEIPNALDDNRFFDNPLVTGNPNIRFYAGAPLTMSNGLNIGTLCVIDDKPKQLSPSQREALHILSKQVVAQMELRLHARKLERLNAERDQIFALLAHDLRSPFNSILNFSGTLANKTASLSPEKIARAAQHILNSALRAFGLLDELLHWSQLQMNDRIALNEVIPLTAIFNECLEFFSESLQLKHLEIQTNMPSNVAVTANRAMAKAILRNLLSNAIKFCDEGSTIVLKASMAEPMVKITVTNTCAELPPNLAGQLFKTTVKSQDGKRGEKGSGIGLMLCNQFVERHGGSMWCEQLSDNQITVGFSLPLASAH